MFRKNQNQTPAHNQTVNVQFIERWPAHEPRKSDPYYKYFNAAKKRMKKQGLLKCNVHSQFHYGQIELHHSLVEFAHANDVDIMKFNEVYGLHLNDDEFKRYIESEGGLEPLCTGHHRGVFGVHSLPEPEWNVLRVQKEDHNIVSAVSNNEIPIVKPKN